MWRFSDQPRALIYIQPHFCIVYIAFTFACKIFCHLVEASHPVILAAVYVRLFDILFWIGPTSLYVNIDGNVLPAHKSGVVTPDLYNVYIP